MQLIVFCLAPALRILFFFFPPMSDSEGCKLRIDSDDQDGDNLVECLLAMILTNVSQWTATLVE